MTPHRHRAHTRGSRVRAACFGVLAGVAAVLPPLLMVRYLSSVGANVVALDYVRYADTMARIATGDYSWMSLPRDSFVVGTHSIWTVFLMRAAVVDVADWNRSVELAVGIVLNLIRAGLVWWAITRVISSRAIRLVMLGAVSVLIFQPSQMNMFSWGDASLGTGIFGIALAVIMMVARRPNLSRAGTCALAGSALVAPGAGAPGAVVAMLACVAAATYWVSERSRRTAARVAAVWGSAAIGMLPYVLYVEPRAHSGVGDRQLDLLQPHFYTALLGLPFSRGFNQHDATRAGIVCLVLLVAVLGAVIATRRYGTWRDLMPAAALVAFGLGNALLVTVFRGTTSGTELVGLSGWYSVYSATVWLGILSAAAVVADRCIRARLSYLRLPRAVFPIAIALVGVLMLLTNLSYDDKNTNLQAQTPMSASCVRHYQTAPPICELFAFSWSKRDSSWLQQLGAPLQDAKLSVFARKQTWTLQGDWALPSTEIVQRSVPGGVRWSAPPIAYPAWSPARPLPRASWHHLDLILEPGSAIAWNPALPAGATRIEFHSRVRSCSDGPASFVLEATYPDGTRRLFTWRSADRVLRLPSRAAAGVRLELRAPRGHSHCVRLAYPRLTLQAPAATAPQQQLTMEDAAAASTSQLAPFDDPSAWRSDDIQVSEQLPDGAGTAFSLGKFPNFTSEQPLSICVDRLRSIRFSVEQRHVVHRMVVVQYRLTGQRGFPRRQSVPIPLNTLQDAGTYRFDMKLLGLPADARIVALRIRPTPVGTGNLAKQWVSISPIVLEWRASPTWNGHRQACTASHKTEPPDFASLDAA